jgi:hypothetical protein
VNSTKCGIKYDWVTLRFGRHYRPSFFSGVHRFRVKHKEGIKIMTITYLTNHSTSKLFNEVCNCQFGTEFWIRPDEANAFLVYTHPKCSPETRIEPLNLCPVTPFLTIKMPQLEVFYIDLSQSAALSKKQSGKNRKQS